MPTLVTSSALGNAARELTKQTVELERFIDFCLESKEFCHNDDFVAECPEPDEVILMTSALYGRMSLGECVKQAFGFLGCYSDVITYAHERCSGRKSCLIRIPDAVLDRTKPCNEDLKSYLDTTYDCIRGCCLPMSGIFNS